MDQEMRKNQACNLIKRIDLLTCLSRITTHMCCLSSYREFVCSCWKLLLKIKKNHIFFNLIRGLLNALSKIKAVQSECASPGLKAAFLQEGPCFANNQITIIELTTVFLGIAYGFIIASLNPLPSLYCILAKSSSKLFNGPSVPHRFLLGFPSACYPLFRTSCARMLACKRIRQWRSWMYALKSNTTPRNRVLTKLCVILLFPKQEPFWRRATIKPSWDFPFLSSADLDG